MKKEISSHDPLIKRLLQVVTFSVKTLAVLITLVIVWGVFDVAYHIFTQFLYFTPQTLIVENLVTIMGNFLAVMIAIEIFMNIIFYLKKDTLHVELVLATALTALARKLIVIDYTVIDAMFVFASSVGVLTTGIAFWLVSQSKREVQ